MEDDNNTASKLIEIKELIRDCNELLNDEFFTLNNIEITRHELNLLLDYITNLQQENGRLLSENIAIKSIRYMVDEVIYKSRCEKAVEYIENNWIEYSDFQYVDNDDELNIDCESIKKLLDILNGRSDKEMNKASERYNKRVEIPISVILETIFSDDNKDVETLCRWAKKYGYVDLIKEDGNKLGYYKLQDDYTKQSFYILLDKEERKQYDYLLDELQRKDNIIKEIKREINEQLEEYEKGKEIYRQFGNLEDYTSGLRSAYINMLDKINELEGDNM